MEWTEKTPAAGDVIRTKVTFYYHYGIFVDEERVIQFGLPDNVNRNASEIKVLATDIYTFMGSGNIEVLNVKKVKNKKPRSKKETVKIAESRIGEGGYDVFNNNCEHFAYNCAFF